MPMNEAIFVEDIPIKLGDATQAMLGGLGLALLFLLLVLSCTGKSKEDHKTTEEETKNDR